MENQQSPNRSFICEDAGIALAHLVQEKDVDTLIVDPPRSGLDDTMKETILKSKIKTMIYVSCNPATLAKDLGVLKKEYRIVKIQPVDMFSQTPHVESVTLLVRNDDYRPRRRFDDRKDRDDKPRRRFDDKKGGDIDLLVVSKEITKKDLRYLRIEFFKYFGEQKIDIILDDGEFKNPFTKHIIKKAVLL